jgi:prepilin-type N-terminal cleavage/methylation domain-containing protein
MKTPFNPRRGPGLSQRGFTLPEVMIALAVFSIGILAVYSMQFASIKGNAVARGVTDNVTLASAKVEELALIAFDDPRLDPGDHNPVAAADGIDNDMDGDIDEDNETGPAQMTWNVVNDCLGADFDGHKCIEVRVVSRPGGGSQKEIRINFIKGNML